MTDTQGLTPQPRLQPPPNHRFCPRCNGGGRIVVRSFNERGGKPNASRDLICCRCGGHGTVLNMGAKTHG